MHALLALSNLLDRIAIRVGTIAAWALVAMVLVTMFDVITRRFLVLGSTKLQELEWHLHTILFVFCLGYAYVKNAHVRIDLLRERLPLRTQWWIELIGICVAVIPFCAAVIYFGTEFATLSFKQNEVSASATGLSHRWIIKSTIPLGFGVLLLAALCIAFRKIVLLFGPAALAAQVTRITSTEEVEPVIGEVKS